MHSFGASAPTDEVMTKFGFTAEHVYRAAKRQLEPAPDSPNRGE
jgi:transketolase